MNKFRRIIALTRRLLFSRRLFVVLCRATVRVSLNAAREDFAGNAVLFP